MKEFILPDQAPKTGTRRCHNCSGTMHPHTYSSTYHPAGAGEGITVHNIHGWKCEACGEIICASAEVKRIESVLLPFMQK